MNEKLKDLMWDIRYYIYTVPKDYYYKVKWFFSNLWRFRKILWRHRTWDYIYCVDLFADSLEWLKNAIEKGHEEERSAIKKVNAIKELVNLLRHCVDDSEFGTWDLETHKVAENWLEVRESNRNYVLNRIFEIIKGQPSSTFKNIDVEQKDWYDSWVEMFDGTGIEEWWD